MTDSKAMLVVGAGDATGGAIARRFAREGLVACVARRHGDKLAPLVDRIEDEVERLFATIEDEVGPLEAVVFNIGANVRFPIRETTTRVYTKVWEMACFGGFLLGREAARVMVPRGRGTIIFTG